MMTAIVTGTK